MRFEQRINNPTIIDYQLIKKELRNGKYIIIQFSDNLYSDKMLAELNELCNEHDHHLSIRFYGLYGHRFNCNILKKLPNVKSLYIDCLLNVDNLETLTELKYLEKLSIGIFELQETEILGAENLKKLKELIITETRTKALNLQYLQDYKDLEFLIIGGHTKNIQSIGTLNRLEYLSLNSISKIPVNFINNLKQLKTLKFILGGRENLNEIEENNIENLEIIRVRGFNKLDNISNFQNLKTLRIEDQIKFTKLNFDNFIPLQDLKLLNCKTFESLIGLNNLTELQRLQIYKTNIDFESFINQPLPKSLDIFTFYTGKTKIDTKINIQLKQIGYHDGLNHYNN